MTVSWKLFEAFGEFLPLQSEAIKGPVSWTDQSLFADVSVNDIFNGHSSLQEFNDVAGFVSESFHLNRIPLSRQS